MEYITESNMKKYESIIDAINKSNAELYVLKRKRSATRQKLFASELFKLKDEVLKGKLIRVIAKVFDTIFELYNLYGDVISEEELKELSRHVNCSFCLVQINILRELIDKLIDPNWFLQITLGNSLSKIVRVIPVISNVTKIFTVLPFVPSCIYNDEINVTLTWINENDNHWPKLHITTIPLNISYYFRTPSIKKITRTNTETSSNLFYNEESTTIDPVVQYKSLYKNSFDNLFKSVMQNCYHRIDPRNAGVFVRNRHEVDVKLEMNNFTRIDIKLNEKLHCLTINTTRHIMLLLKEYFAEQFEFDLSAIYVKKIEDKLLVIKCDLQIIIIIIINVLLLFFFAEDKGKIEIYTGRR